jgi:hypothetical protein
MDVTVYSSDGKRSPKHEVVAAQRFQTLGSVVTKHHHGDHPTMSAHATAT